MTFGARLRRARKRKGLTQAELANQAGLGLRTIISDEKLEEELAKPFSSQASADVGTIGTAPLFQP